MKKFLSFILIVVFLCSCSKNDASNINETISDQPITAIPSPTVSSIDNSAVTNIDEILSYTNAILVEMGISEIDELPQVEYTKLDNVEMADFVIRYNDRELSFGFSRVDFIEEWIPSAVLNKNNTSIVYWAPEEIRNMYDIYSPIDGSKVSDATEKLKSLDEVMSDFYETSDQLTNECIDSLEDICQSFINQ